MSRHNYWKTFFEETGIPPKEVEEYAYTFYDHRITSDMLSELNKEYLNDVGIRKMGDVIAILKHAREVVQSDNKIKVLGSSNHTEERHQKRVHVNSSEKIALPASVQSAPVSAKPFSASNKHSATANHSGSHRTILQNSSTSNKSASVRTILHHINMPSASRQSSHDSSTRNSRVSLTGNGPMVVKDNVPVPTKRRVLPEHEGKYVINRPKPVVRQQEEPVNVFQRLGASPPKTATNRPSPFARLNSDPADLSDEAVDLDFTASYLPDPADTRTAIVSHHKTFHATDKAMLATTVSNVSSHSARFQRNISDSKLARKRPAIQMVSFDEKHSLTNRTFRKGRSSDPGSNPKKMRLSPITFDSESDDDEPLRYRGVLRSSSPPAKLRVSFDSQVKEHVVTSPSRHSDMGPTLYSDTLDMAPKPNIKKRLGSSGAERSSGVISLKSGSKHSGSSRPPSKDLQLVKQSSSGRFNIVIQRH